MPLHLIHEQMERASHEMSGKRMFRVAAMTEAKVSNLEHQSEALGLDVRVRQGIYEEKPRPQLGNEYSYPDEQGETCNDSKTGGGSISCLHRNSIGCR